MSGNSKEVARTSVDSGNYDDEDILVDVDNGSMNSDDSSVGDTSLAKGETLVVSRFRILLLILLLSTALSVSLTAFYLTKQGEYGDFQDAIDSHAQKIIKSFETQASEKRTALIQLSRELTSHALFANQTWPFVHLPDWELRAMLTRELADVVGIFVLPIVARDELEEWANYTVANQKWYFEGMAIQEMYFGVNATESGVDYFDEFSLVEDGDVTQFQEAGPNQNLVHIDPDDPGPFLPCWQFSPQIPVPVINSDFHTLPDARNELSSYLIGDSRRNQNLVGPITNFEPGTGGAVFVDLLLERYSGAGGMREPGVAGGSRNENTQYEGGPLSYYYIPIYENFDRIEERKLVGVLTSFVFWQTYFEDLLPEDAVGIEVVLENTCDQMYTFGISGPEANFLGEGDVHNMKYHDFGHDTEFGVFLQRTPDETMEEDAGCFYKLHVYPAPEMYDKYMTSRPLAICLAILATFLFTVGVFVLYDTFVERRQRLVMKSAQESSNVVSKLFPEEVRDRLYQNENKTKNRDVAERKGHQFLQSVVASKRKSSSSGIPDPSSESDPLQGASPIADFYPNCTVFFADLAGFTKWSSTKSPSEVFLLLETIYGAFDKIAKRLSVFKIETIGDCYVAITGCPKPQNDHAVIMCKFAASCIYRFNQLVRSENITLTLGEDTTNLQMRVGMHSGPVTAGVLRGAKARFQLFGDSVNTAARMESNGQKGKIQVSQATADLLKAAGKERWLTPREDLVEAKGKGKMQTYWVDVGSDPSMRSSITSSKSNGSDGIANDGHQQVVYTHVEV